MERVILITILLVFLAGFAFCEWGVPLLDNFFNTIAVWFQRKQSKMAVTITEDSVAAAKLKQELHPQDDESTSVIGFSILDETEDDEDD